MNPATKLPQSFAIAANAGSARRTQKTRNGTLAESKQSKKGARASVASPGQTNLSLSGASVRLPSLTRVHKAQIEFGHA